MGCAALFGLWALLSATIDPPQAYPEYAPGWHLLGLAVGGIALVAALMERLPLRRLLAAGAALVAIQGLAWFSTLRGPFPFAGGDWLATLAQSTAFLTLGACLAAHFAERGSERARDAFARAILWGLVALTAYHLYHALRQHFVVFPAQLQSYLNAAMAGGPLPPEYGDASPELARRMAHGLSTGRVSSRFGNPNILAGLVATLWAAGPALWALERGRWRWLALAIAGVGSPAILWLTGSRGGVLTFALAVAFGLWLTARALGRRGVATWIAATAAGLLLGLALGRTAPARAIGQTPEAARLLNVDATGQAEGEQSRFRRSSTLRQRLGFLQMGAAMAGEAGFLGFGAGSYEFLFARFQPPRQQESQHAHCAPLDIVVEQGWVGLAAWLLFLGSLLPLLLPDSPAPWPWRRGESVAFDAGRALGAARLAAVVVFLANGVVELTFWQREANLLVWFLAGASLARRGVAGSAEVVPGRRLLFACLACVCVAGQVAFGWMALQRLRAAELIARAEGWEELRDAAALFPRWHIPHLRLAAAAIDAEREGVDPPVGPNGATGPGWRRIAELETRAARALHPTSARLALQLARLLVDEGGEDRRAETEGLLREAEALAPRSSGVHEEAAALWSLLGNEREAKRAERLARDYDHEG
jgi:hypothetical protein